MQGQVGVVKHVFDRSVQAQHAACNRAVCKAALNALEEDGLTAKVVLAVGHAARTRTVGDKNELVALALRNQREQSRMHVEGVCDQLGIRVACQPRAHHGIVLTGSEDLDIPVRFAKCCSPVPGDEIVGYITRGRGVTIHKAECVNAASGEQVTSPFL